MVCSLLDLTLFCVDRYPFSVKPASTWALLKPQYHSLVVSYVYPQLCFTSARAELWQSDPVEYLRAALGTYLVFLWQGSHQVGQKDEYDHYATPAAAATSFLLSLATNRTKTTFLPIMALINNVLRGCVYYTTV
jgi:hypothetical protein